MPIPFSSSARQRKRLLVGLLTAISAFAMAGPVNAQVDVGAVASTEGFGLEIATSLTPAWRARFGAVAGTYDETLTAGDIRYDAEADFKSASAIFDWSPSGGVFHLSLGAIYNDHSIDGEADVLALAIDEFGQAQVDAILALLPAGFNPGFIRAQATYDPLSPYAGFGWRSAKAAGLGFAFDLGAIYLGKAEATVTVSTDLPLGLIPGAQQTLDEFLAEQEREIEREAEDYQIYPVVRLSLFYRF